MFNGAVLFKHDISSWDVNIVTDMSYMFHGAETFNQDLSSWSAHVSEDILRTIFTNVS